MLKKKRLSKAIEVKIFFQFIICNKNYLNIKECNQHIENLCLMTSNRKEGNIFLLTSNKFSLIVAKQCGFCVIPIVQYQANMENDIQLKLVENYLLKLRYANDMKSKNDIDFGYLTQKQARQKKGKASSGESSYENSPKQSDDASI